MRRHDSRAAARRGRGSRASRRRPPAPTARTEERSQAAPPYGDVPLIRRETLAQLAELAGTSSLGLLTARFEEPQGYGRIVRNARGLVQRIVEQKDATAKQLAIRECNTGVLVAAARRLRGWLGRLTAANSQGEYYLTDVTAMAMTSVR